MSILQVITVIALYRFYSIEAYKILAVLPVPAYSHQVVFRCITNELVNRGHDVVVITPYPQYPQGEAPSNLREIDVHDVSDKVYKTINAVKAGKKGSSVNIAENFMSIMGPLVSAQLKHQEVQHLIINERNSTSFDLIILEALAHPALVYSHLFKAPVITISSLGGTLSQYEKLGAANHPILYPRYLSEKIFNLTIFDKFNKLFTYYYYKDFMERLENRDKGIIEKTLNESIPTFHKLLDNVAMIFINFYQIFDFNRPVPPNVVYLGGLYSNPEKALPEDLQAYLDNSKNGVIYISFGTNNYMTENSKKNQILKMVNVFSALNYDFLWKWDDDNLPEQSENIKIGKWFPQPDLLRHPKIKLFITQCGFQSLDDAIKATVPLLAIPFLIDQWYNAEYVVHFQIGRKIIFEDLNHNNFKEALEDVIENTSYKKNMENLRAILEDQPNNPLELAMYWIEYVIRHGGANQLRSSAWSMSLYEYYEVTLVIIAVGIILVLILAVFLLIVACFNCFINKSKKKKVKLY